MTKYSDLICQWLQELGYTHCFLLGGGNIMHLIESCSRHFTCVPVVNEVAAGIAAEYFSEANRNGKAFALVTAGPGLTNIITAMGGAFLESRELLVLGGQVKTADLARGQLRQRGIQEIDGVSIAKPISKHAVLMDEPWSQTQLQAIVRDGFTPRKGPVFLEIPLDVQARQFAGEVPDATHAPRIAPPTLAQPTAEEIHAIRSLLKEAKRPLLLLGGGIDRAVAQALHATLEAWGVPVATTWNGADRMAADHPLYMGRPNTWGQRCANLILQQSDVLIALGTRLGMQQSGFNWQQFAPLAKVVHVDIDRAELEKGHPKTALQIAADANAVLRALVSQPVGDVTEWVAYCRSIRAKFPVLDPVNTPHAGFISPFAFATTLSQLCTGEDAIVPCSSGGAFTVMMQSFLQKAGQTIITNKGSASMGYGLSGAIGMAFATGKRTILVEGDGGFSQNLQEVGTVAVNNLPLKMFIFDDHGYASIRATQRNYFNGNYVGCDIETGLGLPQWEKLFAAYDVPALRLQPGFENDAAFLAAFNSPAPAAFLVPIDPQQTYFPKITSRVLPGGGMESNPLHRMSPDVAEEDYRVYAKYLYEQQL